MIRGLMWRHVFWLSLNVYLLVATITADGAYTLNHGVATHAWDALSRGWGAGQKLQAQKATELDTWTQQKYGRTPETRGASCVSTPAGGQPISVAKVTQIRLAHPRDRAAVLTLLGEPYCHTVAGSDRWLVEGGQSLDADYNPFKYELK